MNRMMSSPRIALSVVLILSAGRVVAARETDSAPAPAVVADGSFSSGGIGVILPVIGRIFAGGNTLVQTSLDVSNFQSAAARVDFVFHGTDAVTGSPISFTGNFVNDGGTLERAFSSVHYEDFIDAMGQKGAITAAQEAHGVLGSLLIVFEGATTSGQGSASARFFSRQFGGTIGVAFNGHEFNRTETTALAGAFTDTRSIAGVPHLYSDIFINNIGLYEPITGQLTPRDDVVRISAFSATTGQPIGTPLTAAIPSFQTLATSLSALGVPAGSGPVVVLARAISGVGALLGVGAEVDDETKDPSGFAMSPVPPSSTGPTPTGERARPSAATTPFSATSPSRSRRRAS